LIYTTLLNSWQGQFDEEVKTMDLDQAIYKALEDVLGPENITDEPAILDAYAWRSGMAAGTTKFMPRFEIITLPKDTEEVQAIIKLCNRFKIQFKPTSTLWSPANCPGGPGVILMDLRRMNRILEINEKNMYAVLEPYVIGAQLQAELMKRGLTCNLNGAGSHVSAFHFAGSLGHGFTSQTHGFGPRNVLAVEWVTPEGEIVRLGSLGSSNEWFCGDGPGPSLRSLIRGGVNSGGGIGVFTKAAQKVYHWPGPLKFPVEGTSPNYAPAWLPENFFLRFISFPSTDKMIEATRKIGESEIALQCSHSISMLASSIATCNEEDLELLEKFRKSAQGPGIVVALAGNSRGEFEYKKKIFQQIIDETDGKPLELIEDPRVWGGILWRFIRMTTAIREAHRATGVWFGNMAGNNYAAIKAKYTQTAARLKDEMISKGLFFDGDKGLIDLMLWPQEHGHRGLAEIVFRYFPTPESTEGVQHLRNECLKVALNEHMGGPYGANRRDLQDLVGPHYSNYHLWLRKIKKAFDPNGVAESTNYITAEE
jgi:glycolate oxidase